MTTVIVCAGGPELELCNLSYYASREDVIFIGADRGAYYLISQGITPTAIVGDFDSLSKDEWGKVSEFASKVERFKKEKDETDTDLALLKALTYAPDEVILTGVTGGRLDHYEAAIRSIYRFQISNPQVKVKIVNKTNEIKFLSRGKHIILADDRYRYLSFFAYESNVENVTLRGVKYETTNERITLGTSRFTSNELLEEVGSISFTSGICLVIRSID